MAANEDALLAEASRLNYRLRSTFFYRKLKEYNTLSFPRIVADLFPVEHLYAWDERGQWGIGEDAFKYVSGNSDFHLLQVFCHPKLIRENIRLLAYYRNVAALSQKSVRSLVKTGVDIKKLESDKENRLSLSESQALTFARLFNEHTTLIVDSSIQTFNKEELNGIVLASTGAQIDGSWRNTIGEEAEKVVQGLLVKEVKERNLIAALFPQKGSTIEPYDANQLEEQLGQIELYRGVLLANRTTILFASEPDVSLLDQNGATILTIEIKGGTDRAGALERYGAAKKSFDKVRQTSPNAATILVASCITAEVQFRIKQDPLITSFYNLTSLLSEGSVEYARFIEQLFNYVNATT